MKQIPLTDLHRQYEAIKPEIDKAISAVIEKKAFIRGPFVEAFETRFSDITESAGCVGVGNGTEALFIALKTLGIRPGDEVITAANSFIATSEAITMTGARVVFADCDKYYGIDPTDVSLKISHRTKAIVPVHLYGQMADMESIMHIATKHNLTVVEDAAQAVLATLNGNSPGSYGQFATYSFFPGKNLGAYGDAGALVSNHPELLKHARMYANHGRTDKYDHEFEGINSRMDGLQGAILEVKLRYLKQWTSKRQEIARLYTNLLQNIPEIIPPRIREGADHVFHIYAIRTNAETRDDLLKHLRNAGISAGIHYPIALPNLRAYQHLNHRPEDFPRATAYSKELISLPIFPELTKAEVKYVVDKIKEFFADSRQS